MPLGAVLAALGRPGGVVLYPTETLWGLGGRAGDGLSARRIAAIMGRPGLPLIVLVPGPPEGLPPVARRLAEALWPGPLTLVVPGSCVPGIAPEVLAPDGTVAVRWSPHPVAAALVQAVGPITSTSANRHGQPPVSDPATLADQVDAVAAGVPGGGLPSTLVHGTTGEVLREGAGAVSVAAILAGG